MPATSRSGEAGARRSGSGRAGSPSKSMTAKPARRAQQLAEVVVAVDAADRAPRARPDRGETLRAARRRRRCRRRARVALQRWRGRSPAAARPASARWQAHRWSRAATESPAASGRDAERRMQSRWSARRSARCRRSPRLGPSAPPRGGRSTQAQASPAASDELLEHGGGVRLTPSSRYASGASQGRRAPGIRPRSGRR